MYEETHLDLRISARSGETWGNTRYHRLLQALGWILFLPMYAYVAVRHHQEFSLAAVLGTPSTDIGARSEIYRAGGRVDDDQDAIDMSYADQPIPASALLPSVGVSLTPEEAHLIARLNQM